MPDDNGLPPLGYFVPSDLIERLAGVAVRTVHEAADMIAMAYPLPLEDWLAEILEIEVCSEIYAIHSEWPHLTGDEMDHLRMIGAVAFHRRLSMHATSQRLVGTA